MKKILFYILRTVEIISLLAVMTVLILFLTNVVSVEGANSGLFILLYFSFIAVIALGIVNGILYSKCLENGDIDRNDNIFFKVFFRPVVLNSLLEIIIFGFKTLVELVLFIDFASSGVLHQNVKNKEIIILASVIAVLTLILRVLSLVGKHRK